MCWTQSWIGWQASLLALASVALVASGAEAAPITSGSAYHTSASIGSDQVIGTPVLRFQEVDHGTVSPGAPFSLGDFVMSKPPAGETTIYAGTPFTITYMDQSDSEAPPLVARGFLLGTVSGSGKSTLLATLNFQAFLGDPSLSGLQYQTGNVIHSLNLNFPVILNDTTVNQGETVVMGQLKILPVTGQFEIVPAPEPSTWALFLATAAALRLRRRSRTSHCR